MLGDAKAIYLATRKRNDQLFNTYVMRPLAGLGVAILARTPITPNQVTILGWLVFLVAGAALVALPDPRGALIAVAILELSYFLDCCDGMLARHKKIASTQGHLFDFFTDESKALILVGTLGVRLWRVGGHGLDAEVWPTGSPWFLLATVAGVTVVASATSLTNFVRRPEISGRETPVEAHYESLEREEVRSLVARLGHAVMTFLRFLNHYPSHIWLFALLGRLDLFFWIYLTLNSLYLAKGWLGLLLRFGRT
ncbi:MAG: CDP-alcohol phosphatidyltransferase family protein [Polyangiaceae bacterium]